MMAQVFEQPSRLFDGPHEHRIKRGAAYRFAHEGHA